MRSITIPELADLCAEADHVDIKTVVSKRSLRELIAASFSWQPAWLRWLFAMRGVLARAFRLENPDTPVQERRVRPDEISMSPGDALWFFTGVEDRYLLVESSDMRLVLSEQAVIFASRTARSWELVQSHHFGGAADDLRSTISAGSARRLVHMPLIDTQSEAMTSRAWWRNLSAWGGLLAACGGLFHTVVAALERSEVWAQIVDEGFLNTVTLDPSADRLAVAEAYWFSVGSFGVPLLLLGALVTWLTRRGVRVPGWLGCGVAAWAFLIGLLGGFDTGSIILLSIGVLLAVDGWNARRAPARRTRPA